MKKILLTIFLSLIWIGSASSQERETEWEGKCLIQFDGKVLVDNEICKMGSDDMPIDKKDEFLVVVTKYVACDDGSNGCQYFFYAQQDKLLGKYYWEVSFNGEKDMVKAVVSFRPADIDYYLPSGGGSGVCFIKENNKFCFEY